MMTLPVETFQTLLSFCAKQSNWKFNISGHLSRYHASFDVSMGTYLLLTQKNKNTIQVSTWTSKEKLDKEEATNDEIREFILGIRREIERKTDVLGVKQSGNFQIVCPHWRRGDEYLCLVEMEEKMEPALENVLFCPVSARCVMHKKALEPFLRLSTGNLRKGI